MPELEEYIRGGFVARKGSMQLSIEAIIVLVIAIVLLGLGIAFVKNFFGTGSDVLLGQFDPLKEGCNVNEQTPMVPLSFEIKQGSSKQEKICVFNNAGAPITKGIFKFENCMDPAGVALLADATGTGTCVSDNAVPPASPACVASSITAIKIRSLGQDIARGASTGFKTTFDIAGAAPLGTYICNIKVDDGTGKIGPFQATIQVS